MKRELRDKSTSRNIWILPGFLISNKPIKQLYKTTGDIRTLTRYLVSRNYSMFRCNYSIVVIFYKQKVLLF